jgi:hypothetical protein
MGVTIYVCSMSDTMQMIIIGMLFVFILAYLFYVCRPSPSKKGPKFRKQRPSAYRTGVYRDNNPRFVKEGAEERIRRRMQK